MVPLVEPVLPLPEEDLLFLDFLAFFDEEPVVSPVVPVLLEPWVMVPFEPWDEVPWDEEPVGFDWAKLSVPSIKEKARAKIVLFMRFQ